MLDGIGGNFMSVIDNILNIANKVVNPVKDLISEFHMSPDEKVKADQALQQMQNAMTTEFIQFHEKEMEAQKEIVLAEAKGSFLQRNWRPILMLSIVAIVVNNYIIYPYLTMFTDKAVVLELPDKLWNLMLVGTGGYIAGRSSEKITETLKRNQ